MDSMPARADDEIDALAEGLGGKRGTTVHRRLACRPTFCNSYFKEEVPQPSVSTTSRFDKPRTASQKSCVTYLSTESPKAKRCTPLIEGMQIMNKQKTRNPIELTVFMNSTGIQGAVRVGMEKAQVQFGLQFWLALQLGSRREIGLWWRVGCWVLTDPEVWCGVIGLVIKRKSSSSSSSSSLVPAFSKNAAWSAQALQAWNTAEHSTICRSVLARIWKLFLIV